MDKILIGKYLRNKCSQEELDIVLSWLCESALASDVKDVLYNEWIEMNDDDSGNITDFNALLSRIHHEINKRESLKLLEEANYNLIKYRRKKHVLRFLRNVAAIIFLPVLGAGLFFTVKYYSVYSVKKMASWTYNEVFSSVDAITRVTLPDGSVVWLNHSSSLRYPAVFMGNSRQVELKGEGYFEAAHSEMIPFIVDAGDIHVVAHGTTFNVMAYPDEDKIETSLISGSVELQKSLPGRRSETLYKMSSGDLSVYDKNKEQLTTRFVNDDRYFSWKDGKLIFTADPMEEVIKKLSRWFNIDIEIHDPELLDMTLTATFVQETLPQVLELLTLISPVSYTISNRKETPEGTFTKRKVILSLK